MSSSAVHFGFRPIFYAPVLSGVTTKRNTIEIQMTYRPAKAQDLRGRAALPELSIVSSRTVDQPHSASESTRKEHMLSVTSSDQRRGQPTIFVPSLDARRTRLFWRKIDEGHAKLEQIARFRRTFAGFEATGADNTAALSKRGRSCARNAARSSGTDRSLRGQLGRTRQDKPNQR